MKRWIWLPLLAACLALGGCSALLERSYSLVEPYSDRYWDTGAEDTLRAETYQDLVNSMMMLIEQGAEEGVIRCYGEANAYSEVIAARGEVRQETVQGAYLLQELSFTYEPGTNYSTVTCRIAYREDAEDPDSLMTLSDSQSLVDLLRLAVREEHEKLTARFTYNMPREDVAAAVESLWQELCQAELDAAAEEAALEAEAREEAAGEAVDDSAAAPPEEDGDPPDPPPEEGGPEEEEPPPPVEYPPCPWDVRFYPDRETAEIVEILLQPS